MTDERSIREQAGDGPKGSAHRSPLVGDPGYTGGLTMSPEKDPWKHRSEGMRCRTCMSYVPKVALESPSVPVPEIGRCRRHAPTMSGFPAVFPADWCGDHKLDETKV